MSVQASLNSLIGSISGTAFQLAAPRRFAKSQKEEEDAKKAIEEEARNIEIEALSDQATKGGQTPEEEAVSYEKLGTATQKNVDRLRREYEANPTTENYKKLAAAEDEAQSYFDYADIVRQDQAAYTKQVGKIEILTNQKNAMKERAEWLKSLSTKEMAEELHSRGHLSGTKTREAIHRDSKGGSK